MYHELRVLHRHTICDGGHGPRRWPQRRPPVVLASIHRDIFSFPVSISSTIVLDVFVLFLIGGPARVGKTTLAESLLRQLSIPCASTAMVARMLFHIDAGLGLLGSGRLDADILIPYLRIFAKLAVEKFGKYTIEGDAVRPQHVVGLMSLLAEYGMGVRVVFLGNSTLTAEKALRHQGLDQAYRTKGAELTVGIARQSPPLDNEDGLVFATAVAAQAQYLISNDAGFDAVDGRNGVQVMTPEQWVRYVQHWRKLAGK